MAKQLLTNEKGYSLSICAWLGDDDYDHTPVKGPYLSVTGLLKPERMIILNQRVAIADAASGATEEMDLDRFVASRLGTAIHSAIEYSWTRKLKDGSPAFKAVLAKLGYDQTTIDLVKVNPTEEDIRLNPAIIPVYMEIRATKKVGGYTIGGKYDFIGQGVLEDFKSMGAWGYMQGDKDEEQLMQGSMYRWLNPKLVTSDNMRIQQIITDWSKIDSFKQASRGYPQNRIVEKILPLLSVADTEAWIKAKIAKIESLLKVPEADLPLCTEKELWQKPAEYKYYALTKKKTISKMAKATYVTPEAAYAHYDRDGKVGRVREIPSVAKRCGYCNGRPLCSQFADLESRGLVQLPG